MSRLPKLLVSDSTLEMLNRVGAQTNLDLFDPEGATEIDHDSWKKHWKQIRESQGFDVTCFPRCKYPAYSKIIGPTEKLCSLAKIALDQFNSTNNEQYEFVNVLKANATLAEGYIYFITFEALRANPTNDTFVTFQAKVRDTPPKAYVLLCRIKAASPSP